MFRRLFILIACFVVLGIINPGLCVAQTPPDEPEEQPVRTPKGTGKRLPGLLDPKPVPTRIQPGTNNQLDKLKMAPVKTSTPTSQKKKTLSTGMIPSGPGPLPPELPPEKPEPTPEPDPLPPYEDPKPESPKPTSGKGAFQSTLPFKSVDTHPSQKLTHELSHTLQQSPGPQPDPTPPPPKKPKRTSGGQSQSPKKQIQALPTRSDLSVAKGPDLVVTSIRVTGMAKVNSKGNVEVPVRVVVKNKGKTPAGIFKVATKYKAPGGTFAVAFTVSGQSDKWYPKTRTSLRAGRQVTFSGKVTIPSSVRVKAVYLRAVADSCSGDEIMPGYCRVQETNEGNNESAAITVALPRSLTVDFSEIPIPMEGQPEELPQPTQSKEDRAKGRKKQFQAKSIPQRPQSATKNSRLPFKESGDEEDDKTDVTPIQLPGPASSGESQSTNQKDQVQVLPIPVPRPTVKDSQFHLSGRVTNRRSGESLAGKTVILSRTSPRKPKIELSVVTDDEGNYNFPDLADGTYKIKIDGCKGGGTKKVVFKGAAKLKSKSKDFRCK